MDNQQLHIPSNDELRGMSQHELNGLCRDLRSFLVETVSHTGGHLSSNLGVVELTVAMHREFCLPSDKIVWDVGHQCYVHKLLTGRYERFDTLRQEGGITGFPAPGESETDCFIVGHSSTSISAANGLAKAKTLTKEGGYVVAVIGDGALTGGLAYEGLCNAGRSKDKLIVVLNDNRMSISSNVGFVARHLSRMRSRPRYLRIKYGLEWFLKHIPLIGSACCRALWRLKNRLKTMVYRNSTLYEEMGFYYLGPVDGHDLIALEKAFRAAKDVDRPVLMHVETIKGQGYSFAEQCPDVFHGVSGFDAASGRIPASGQSFSSVFGDTLTQLAKEDERICAVTAAMTGGTGLSGFAQAFPKRFFDTGIAEEHAVTFSSGMAAGGLLPVFAVYSTFLQRSYDQLLNDTAIMGNHIVLGIDRAGLVPDDGETHQGIFDVAYLRTIPGMTVYAPASYSELQLQLKQALYDETGPVAVRYPKGSEPGEAAGYEPDYQPYRLYPSASRDVLIVTYGTLFFEAVKAVAVLEKQGWSVSLLKLNRLLPLDVSTLNLIAAYRRVIVFEEVSITGSMGEYIAAQLALCRFGGNVEVHGVTSFVGACKVEAARHRFGLDAVGMVQTVQQEKAK